MKQMTIGLLAALAVSTPAFAGDGILFVDDDALAAGDGLTWDTAYRFLQDALASAADPANGVTEIRVGQGIYQPDRDEVNPDGTGEREATFQLANGVALMGGYAGIGADDPNERDVELYETILSGDLLGDDGDDFANAEENSINVVTVTHANSTTVMDGLLIRGGFAEAGASLDGGGLLIVAGALRIRYCTFESNAAEDDGGAIFAEFADLLFESCDFIGNQCNSSGGAICARDCKIVIQECLLQSNLAPHHNGGAIVVTDSVFVCENSDFVDNIGWRGGAMSVGGHYATVTNCTLSGNSSTEGSGGAVWHDNGFLDVYDSQFIANHCDAPGETNGGGAFRNHDGVGIYVNCLFESNSAASRGGAGFTTRDRFIRCTFRNNDAPEYGGAVFVKNDTEFASCSFINNTALSGGAVYADEIVAITHCKFLGNAATSDGGAIKAETPREDVFLNCLFSGNSAGGSGGGLYLFDLDRPVVANCAFVGNTAGLGGGLHIFEFTAEEAPDVRSCIFWDNVDDDGMDESAQIHIEGVADVNFSTIQGLTGDLGGIGNIGDDPFFVDADGPDDVVGTEDDDLRLLAGSPCIDAADNTPLDSCLIDLDQRYRFFDDPATVDTGVGDGAVVDMGVFEFGASPSTGDCNGTGLDDQCETATDRDLDCNANGIPDECDIASGRSPDCNGNGIADECDIAEGGESSDCDGNGVPDECDPDCNGNAIPDVCDIADGPSQDCNRNGLPDECDLAAGLESDCNFNGVLDSCEIANGDAEDCNGNGVPDDCDLSDQFRFDSGSLAPLDYFNPHVVRIPAPPEALGTVTFSFAAAGNVGFGDIEILLNGQPFAVVFDRDEDECGGDASFDSLSIDPGDFNELVGGADVWLTAIASMYSHPCDFGSHLNLNVKYLRNPGSSDSDGDGVPDECDAVLGDVDGDGDVDAADLILLLGAWGACGDCANCPADLDGDCDVDGSDLILLLGNWG